MAGFCVRNHSLSCSLWPWYICVYMHVCTHMYMYIYIHVCIYIHMYIYIYMSIYICVYTFIVQWLDSILLKWLFSFMSINCYFFLCSRRTLPVISYVSAHHYQDLQVDSRIEQLDFLGVAGTTSPKLSGTNYFTLLLESTFQKSGGANQLFACFLFIGALVHFYLQCNTHCFTSICSATQISSHTTQASLRWHRPLSLMMYSFFNQRPFSFILVLTACTLMGLLTKEVRLFTRILCIYPPPPPTSPMKTCYTPIRAERRGHVCAHTHVPTHIYRQDT